MYKPDMKQGEKSWSCDHQTVEQRTRNPYHVGEGRETGKYQHLSNEKDTFYMRRFCY